MTAPPTSKPLKAFLWLIPLYYLAVFGPHVYTKLAPLK